MKLAQYKEEAGFADEFAGLRASTTALCAGLSPEDCNLQAMAETSPAKWHLAHTTWFFETFVLEPYAADYLPVNPLYRMLFNSYYNGVGAQYPRPQRGLLSRPSLDEVLEYRDTVTAAVTELLQESNHPEAADISARVELGMHHEAQHQELLLTDLKYSLFQNPLFPAYREQEPESAPAASPLGWVGYAGGEVATGHDSNGFAFDNETPRHAALLRPFQLASRLVTNGEYLEFIADEGYDNPEYWLSDGWSDICETGIRQPLYWGNIDGEWFEYTLHGLQPLDLNAPVSHVSGYEAQAYAAWSGQRLPTETEWECVAQSADITGNFLDSEALRPLSATGAGVQQLFGDCWEWTNSAYLPYPGYRASAGALGEYNGKFMSGQMVLRGGSCLSRAFHIRPSYRNFFYARDRWQCTGIRLAKDS